MDYDAFLSYAHLDHRQPSPLTEELETTIAS
jgi:hypothetical protein